MPVLNPINSTGTRLLQYYNTTSWTVSLLCRRRFTGKVQSLLSYRELFGLQTVHGTEARSERHRAQSTLTKAE